jgi:septation ring formation regulator EzrA
MHGTISIVPVVALALVVLLVLALVWALILRRRGKGQLDS